MKWNKMVIVSKFRDVLKHRFGTLDPDKRMVKRIKNCMAFTAATNYKRHYETAQTVLLNYFNSSAARWNLSIKIRVFSE